MVKVTVLFYVSAHMHGNAGISGKGRESFCFRGSVNDKLIVFRTVIGNPERYTSVFLLQHLRCTFTLIDRTGFIDEPARLYRSAVCG